MEESSALHRALIVEQTSVRETYKTWRAVEHQDQV